MTEDRKLSIICSKGSLDMAYPGLILANAARMLGIEANIFFTFWGMDIISKDKVDHLKVTPVGNTAMHMPQAIGWLPGMADMATVMMKREMTKLDIRRCTSFWRWCTMRDAAFTPAAWRPI
jgi:peroxiredoxin family protein